MIWFVHRHGGRGFEPRPHEPELGKAGRKRHMGWRPHVRGVAMNPIDHPHGGGEGRTSGGRTPVTPWGKDTKGTRTRRTRLRTSTLSVPATNKSSLRMARSSWKGPFVDGYLLKKAGAGFVVGPQGRDQDTGRAAPPSYRSSSV